MSDASLVAPQSGVVVRLLPYAAIILFGLATVGLPLPVLPAHVRDVLGFDETVVGLVIGLQSLATLVTRHYAGTIADARGPRAAVLRGAAVIALAGLAYCASLAMPGAGGALALLLVGRLLLGVGESLLMTGALSWGISAVGPQHAGKVMTWLGIALFAAIAGGAPIGAWLGGAIGLRGLAILVTALPLVAFAIGSILPDRRPPSGPRLPFRRVIGMIWPCGAGLFFSGIAFGGLAAFVTLYYAAAGWGGASLALTAFAAGYIGARLFFGHLPDRLGGARVALVSLLVEGLGQLLLWQAPSPEWALAGAALSGVGFSLVFPGLGVEAVKRVPPANRGSAMGAYAAFFDISLGIAAPLAGLVARQAGYPAIFLLGAGGAAVSALFALSLMRR